MSEPFHLLRPHANHSHGSMKRILHEPLLHFLLLGAAIFAVHRLVSAGAGFDRGRIVITQGEVAALAEGFARTWQRPPTSTELEGLIQDQVREDIYCREAIALGLDKDDSVVRRRLRQKMEFLAEDAAVAEPSDAELEAYLRSHADAFRVQRFSFRHVYLSRERRGANLARDAARLLAELIQKGSAADVGDMGDPFLLDRQFESVAADEVARIFGDGFAAQLGRMPPGQWGGPIESGYGAHLVLVTERTDGRVPALAEVRDAVRRGWLNARRAEANEQLYQKLLKRYVVTIERPQAPEGGKLVGVRVR